MNIVKVKSTTNDHSERWSLYILKVKLLEKMNFQNFPEISGLVDFLPQGQDQETYQNQISYEDITKCYEEISYEEISYEEISYEEISRELLEASYETCEKKN